MDDTSITALNRKLPIIFWSMVFIHVITWTLAPALVRHAVSNDIIEAITWGNQFQWGYDKNPWAPALLAHLGVVIGGTSAIGIYFIQQLFIILAFWSICRLTFLLSNNPAYAFIACMMFEASICYTLNVQLYNDNYILLGLWPLSALIFYYVLQTHQFRYWVALSIVLGLATMAKYDSLILVGLYGFYLFIDKNRWHYFASVKAWVSFVIYLLILLPNFIWLQHHNFISLHYAFVERANYQNHHWYEYALHNLNFIKATLINFLPALILMLLATSNPKTLLSFSNNCHSERSKESRNPNMHQEILRCAQNDKITKGFVFLISFAPLLTLLLIALVMGLNLANEWGMVLMGFWGSYLLMTFQPIVTTASLKRFIVIVYFILIVWPVGYIVISLKKDTGNYPGPEIAQIVSNTWQQHFKQPLRYVAGSRYVAGYVSFYTKDKPAVFMEWNTNVSPWINVDDLKCKGAVFVQDSGHTVMQKDLRGMQFPDAVLKNYPNLIVLPPITVPWYRNHNHHQDLSLLIGLLPPASNCVK